MEFADGLLKALRADLPLLAPQIVLALAATVMLWPGDLLIPRGEKRRWAGVTIIALFIAAMSTGKQPVVFGDGLQSRDFTYVLNATQAVMKAADAPAAVGKVYNIGVGGNTTLLDLIAGLNQLLGTKLEPVFQPARAGDVRHSQADITAAKKDLGYEPKYTFMEGLKATLDAHLEGK
jgi:UDP-glucose 4-epimerase